MSSYPNATSLHPFDTPMHALVVSGAALMFRMPERAIKEIAQRGGQMHEISKQNPWTILIRARANTHKDQWPFLPNVFFNVYGGFGSVSIPIGYAFGVWGLISLAVSLSKKLF